MEWEDGLMLSEERISRIWSIRDSEAQRLRELGGNMLKYVVDIKLPQHIHGCSEIRLLLSFLSLSELCLNYQ